MGKEENLAAALAMHAKVILKPEVDYELTEPLRIGQPCIVVGNGAKIKVSTPASPVVAVEMQLQSPAIEGLKGVTFSGVRFESTVGAGNILFSALCPATFLSCDFYGFNGCCLNMHAGGMVKGCVFVTCHRCIRVSGPRRVSVGQCLFDRCLVAVSATHDVALLGNTAVCTYCFCLVGGGGVIRYNTVLNPHRWVEDNHFELSTCLGGEPMPLYAVHFPESLRHPWPEFSDNVFMKCKIYVGNRRGAWNPVRCAFNYSQLCMQRGVLPKFVPFGCFHQTALLTCLSGFESESTEVVKCECGLSHTRRTPHVQNVTARFRLREQAVDPVDLCVEDVSSGVGVGEIGGARWKV